VLDTAGAVTGTVTDAAGQPLAGVTVSVSNSSTTDYGDPFGYYPPALDGPARDAVTDAAGHFAVRGVQPGGQTVCFNAAHARGGDSATGYVDTCVGGGTAETADLVDVRAGRAASVRATLAAGAAISGSAVAGSTRLTRPTVFVFRVGGGGAAANVRRDGSYRLSRLPAGTYRVCFVAFRYQPECFRDVAWTGKYVPRDAAKIAVESGEERTGVDAELARASHNR
jgi:hypothetical protein